LKATTKLLIIGAGGHGQSVAEAAELSGQFEVVGFVDDGLAIGTLVLGYPVLGSAVDLTAYVSVCDQVLVAIGNNTLRTSLAARLTQAGLSLATVVLPYAMVSQRAQIGAGSAVMACATVGTEAQLGLGSIVNCGAVVNHQARVENFGHLGVGACMAGGTVLGDKAWMQTGSSIGYDVVVDACAALPPGAVFK
jgi:sugar O-acyltransferase (sialic acid O-acetyltransferase NeuD family)